MYSFEQIMAPVWDTEVIYDESLTMVRKNGIAQAPLLFEPIEILSVTSADKTMEYEKGKDWEIQGNMFYLKPESRIFAFEEKELIFDEEKSGESFEMKDGRFSLFHEGHYFHDRQISVTYKKKSGSISYAPEFCGELLPKTMAKLRQKENVRIVLFGDSISAGANSSGMTLTTPFLPRWGDLVQESLQRYYGAKVELINTAVGGMDSHWGMAEAKCRVGQYKPDLAIIAFGMNDRDEPKQFVENIKVIMNRVLEDSPETEFLICATSVPNAMLKHFGTYQSEHGAVLKELQGPGIAVADFGSMHKCLLEKKRFIDMTGNNVNHPNDFLIRCHAQVVAALLSQKNDTIEKTALLHQNHIEKTALLH